MANIDEDVSEIVLKRLSCSLRNVTNYYDVSNHYEAKETEYEKKLSNAPLIGCGAGLALIGSAIATGKVPAETLAILIVSLWCFLSGVFTTFLAGFFYTRFLSKSCGSQRSFGEAQTSILDIYDGIRRAGYVSDKKLNIFSDFPEYTENFRKSLESEAEGMIGETIANRQLLFARIFLGIGVILFTIGTVFPLTVLSFQFQFFWQ